MPTENEKQLTAMQSYIEELQALKDIALQDAIDARNNNEPTASIDAINVTYSIAIKAAKSKLATERKQLIDAHKDGATFVFKNSETYYNDTFKTQK